MTQDEARKLLHSITMAAIKARSNLIEALGDNKTAYNVAAITEPMLFPREGELDLLKALTLMEKKPRLERQDIVSIIYMTNKSLGTLMLMQTLWDEYLPDMMGFMQGKFED